MQVQVSDTPEDGGRGVPEMLTAQSIAHLRGVATQHTEGEDNECSHMLVAVPEEQWQNQKVAAAYDTALKQAGAQSLGIERQALCALHGVDHEEQRRRSNPDDDWWEEGRLVVICDVGRSVEVSLIRLGDPENVDVEVLSVIWQAICWWTKPDNVIIDQLLSNFEREQRYGFAQRPDDIRTSSGGREYGQTRALYEAHCDINLPYISADAMAQAHECHTETFPI